jgi:hypothetical protein
MALFRAVLFLGLLLLLVACASAMNSTTLGPGQTSTALPRPTATIAIETLMPRDAIKALIAPPVVAGAQLAHRLPPDDQVIGVVLGGEARAYPIMALLRHAIINDQVGGVPIVVTFCGLCNTGAVYHRTVNEQVFTFGVSGKAAMNASVMYDHETESLWGQVMGRAIEGPLTGTSLEFLTATQTTWQEWLQTHPVTTVLDDTQDEQILATSAADPMTLLLNTRRLLPEYIIGLVGQREIVVYPFGVLQKERVVNDELEGQPIVVFFDPATGTGTVWERPIQDGKPLTFTPVAESGFTVKDEQTGSRWSGLGGQAEAGPLTGQQLTRVPARYSFGTGWLDAYPTSRVFESKH